MAVRKTLETSTFKAHLLQQNPSASAKMAILLHVNNTAVVRILPNMVSASPELMVELRRYIRC